MLRHCLIISIDIVAARFGYIPAIHVPGQSEENSAALLYGLQIPFDVTNGMQNML